MPIRLFAMALLCACLCPLRAQAAKIRPAAAATSVQITATIDNSACLIFDKKGHPSVKGPRPVQVTRTNRGFIIEY